jgi:hypothetical protein
MITPQQLIDFSSYLSIIHHIKGRIRLRVNPEIKKLNNSNMTLETIESIPKSIEGIHDVKINKIVGSVTITYDATIFPDELWVNLIEQKNLEHITSILNKLIKEFN